MSETFHLTPVEIWTTQEDREQYVPESFSSEGFIHCTDGANQVIAVGNRYYRNDPRSYLCLIIDIDRVVAPIRYEDEARIYPHIHGPLNLDAIIQARRVNRADDGVFVSIDN